MRDAGTVVHHRFSSSERRRVNVREIEKKMPPSLEPLVQRLKCQNRVLKKIKREKPVIGFSFQAAADGEAGTGGSRGAQVVVRDLLFHLLSLPHSWTAGYAWSALVPRRQANSWPPVAASEREREQTGDGESTHVESRWLQV